MTEQNNQQSEQIKQILFEQFYKSFQDISNQVKRLPLTDFQKMEVLRWFDVGYVMGKEMFNALSFNVPPMPPESPAANNNAIQETDCAVTEDAA